MNYTKSTTMIPYRKNVPNLFIMLPTLDEEMALADVYNRIPQKIGEKGYNARVTIVDGGSKDKTLRIADDLDCEIIQQWGGKRSRYSSSFQEIP